MNEPVQECNVGARIRTLRNRKGHSLRALAGLSGLSSNAISLIERGENSPTVSSLRQLANALEVPIVAFFQDDSQEQTVFVKAEQRAKSTASGTTIESLGTGLHGQRLEPFLVTVQPGSNAAAGTYVHEGEEFVLCMEGRLEYRVGDRLYTMEPGDSLLFKASQVHGFSNPEGHLAIALIIIDEHENPNDKGGPRAHPTLHG